MAFRLLALCFLFSPPIAEASEQEASNLTLEIRHWWEGRQIAIPAGDLAMPSGETVELTRLAYLLSLPQVQQEGGRWLGRKSWFAHVDAETEVNRLMLTGLPRGNYTGLQFLVGLDPAADRSDPNQYPPSHPLNPVRNNLHWSWQGSYIYLALEGRLQQVNEKDPLGFAYHLGNPASLMRVSLPVEFDMTRDAVIAIDFHLDRVLAGENAIDIPAHTSTHGREGDETAVALVRNIQNAFAIREVRTAEPETTSKESEPAESFVGTPYEFKFPKHFPIPELPEDFPLTEERVALGKKLFHDPILSRAETISCASCHKQEDALSDSRRFSLGDKGQEGTRQSMPLFNLAWKSSFFWDGRAPSLRAQALMPIEDPLEMHESLGHVVDKLAAHDDYPGMFEAAFGEAEITEERLGIALEQFVLTLTSFDSKFDRASRGEATLSEQEKRGFELFFTEYDPRRQQFGADCFHCHGGANFSDHGFHNNGLAPTADLGLEKHTGSAGDRHKFSTPSLRNIALTAPYMHDGRFATLEEVVDHYTEGIQSSQTLDPNFSKHGGGGVPLSDQDKAALIAFLKSLSDPQFEP